MKTKTRKKREYKVINIHPTYASEEEKQEAYKRLALELALMAEELRKIYPNQKF